MAVTNVPEPMASAFLAHRPGMEVNPGATLRSGLVSDLLVGDYLWGQRATVITVGAVSGTNQSFVVRRRGTIEYTVTMPTASTLWFAR